MRNLFVFLLLALFAFFVVSFFVGLRKSSAEDSSSIGGDLSGFKFDVGVLFNMLFKGGNGVNSMSAREFIDLASTGEINNYTVLDVRTHWEYREGHIENSLHKPLDEIKSVDDTLNFDKSLPIIIYCRSGNRSFTAGLVFSEAGFRVYNLEGGIVSLNRALK